MASAWGSTPKVKAPSQFANLVFPMMFTSWGTHERDGRRPLSEPFALTQVLALYQKNTTTPKCALLGHLSRVSAVLHLDPTPLRKLLKELKVCLAIELIKKLQKLTL